MNLIHIKRLFLYIFLLIIITSPNKCTPPEEEEMTILLPTSGEEIIGTRTDIIVKFNVPIRIVTFHAELNGASINSYFYLPENVKTDEIHAKDVPIAYGNNHLEIQVLAENRKGFLVDSVDFKGVSNPLKIKGKYVFEIPLNVGEKLPKEDVNILTLFADFKKQEGFFAEGEAIPQKINDDRIEEELSNPALALADAWEDKFRISFIGIYLPLDKIIPFIVEPLEEELGIDIPEEKMKKEEVPLIDIVIEGNAVDTNNDKIIDRLDGTIVSATFSKIYDLGISGDPISGILYNPLALLQGGYIFKIPITIGDIKENDPYIFTIYTNFTKQNGIFAEGSAQILEINGKLLNESGDPGIAYAEVEEDKFNLFISGLEIPTEETIYAIIDLLENQLGIEIDIEKMVEEVLGVDIPVENIELDDIPLIDIEITGTVINLNDDKKAEELNGTIVSATFGKIYDMKMTGYSLKGYSYETSIYATGAFLFELPVVVKDKEIVKIIYHLKLNQKSINISGSATMIGINDTIFVNLPESTKVYGLAFEDNLTINFDVLAPLENELFLYLLEVMGIVIPPIPIEEPIFHMALDGKMITDEELKVNAIDGSFIITSRYGAIDTPGYGFYHARKVVEDGFVNGRLIDAKADFIEIGIKEPVPILFCADVKRDGALILGDVHLLRLNGKPFDFYPVNTGTTGAVVYPAITMSLLSLTGDDAKLFYELLSEFVEEQTGNPLPTPQIPEEIAEQLPEIPEELEDDLKIPDHFKEVNLNIVGTINENNSSTGKLSGSIFWGMSFRVTGSYEAPLLSEDTNVSGNHVATIIINMGASQIGSLQILMDLSLKQNGCSIKGKEEITGIKGITTLPSKLKSHSLTGANLGNEIDLILYDKTLAEIIDQNFQNSGPVVKIILRGNISNNNSKITIQGDVLVTFIYDKIPLKIGTFSTTPK